MSITKKPFATDWEIICEDLEYTPTQKLYWHNNRVYCEVSARHNGLIGLGARLKKIIKDTN